MCIFRRPGAGVGGLVGRQLIECCYRSPGELVQGWPDLYRDAAHAMSPVGGVGINLAIQDAVATANLLYEPLSRGSRVPVAMLRQVQKRRTFPTRVTQALQVRIQKGIVDGRGKTGVPLVMRMVDRFPVLRRIPAMLVGKGVRPEHVRSPAVEVR